MLRCYYKIMRFVETIINIIIVIVLNIKLIFIKQNLPVGYSDKFVVLGNGPSLKNDLDIIINCNINCDFAVVNGFVNTELFSVLKPKYYFLIDPAFYEYTNIQRLNILVESVLTNLIKKTNWTMYLFLPYNAKKSYLCNEIMKNNTNINIVYLKNIPIIGGNYKINNILYKYNLANPLYQNVLVAAIFIGLKMKFKNIDIYGADHSWHENYVLGSDNCIYTPDIHFFSKNEKEFKHVSLEGIPIKVHEEFLTLSRAFSIYVSIEKYSTFISSNIINCSSKTWIDAFKRKC